MDNITRRDAGLPYISDDAVFDQQKVTRRLLREFNTTDPRILRHWAGWREK